MPIEYHPYQYQNKDWDAALSAQFYSPSGIREEEEERAQRIADWQDRLAKEAQLEHKIAKKQLQAANKKLRSHRRPYGRED